MAQKTQKSGENEQLKHIGIENSIDRVVQTRTRRKDASSKSIYKKKAAYLDKKKRMAKFSDIQSGLRRKNSKIAPNIEIWKGYL